MAMNRLNFVYGGPPHDAHWTSWTPFCNLASGTNRCVTIVEILGLVLVAAGIALTVVLIRQLARR
jgi:hypothetical protein